MSDENESDPRIGAGGRTSVVMQGLLARYPEAQYRIAQFVVEQLADIFQYFGGDLVLLLVLGIAAQARLQAEIAESRGQKRPSHWISASRISDISGVSRQTVRRKLTQLEQRGLVRQDSKSRWQLVDQIETAQIAGMEPLVQREMERVARLFVELEKLLK